MKYRKKPVVIEARLVPLWGERVDSMSFVAEVIKLAEWCGGTSHMMDPPEGIQEGIHIATLEGTMVASPGDFIIRGVQGEFYPCKPDIFAATYEPVDDDDE